jgi:ribulose-5-phosphate 4-epimerase/fuculose-1-phosphate aldolase
MNDGVADEDASQLLSRTAARLDDAGLLFTGGNLSVRTGPTSYLITQTGFVVNEYASAARLAPVGVDTQQLPTAGASSESPLHSAIYRRFPQFAGVCHAHSPAIIALGPPDSWPALTTTVPKSFPVHVIPGNGEALATAAEPLLSRRDEDLVGPNGFTVLAPGHGIFTAGPTIHRAAHLVLRIHENALAAAYHPRGT